MKESLVTLTVTLPSIGVGPALRCDYRDVTSESMLLCLGISRWRNQLCTRRLPKSASSLLQRRWVLQHREAAVLQVRGLPWRVDRERDLVQRSRWVRPCRPVWRCRHLLQSHSRIQVLHTSRPNFLQCVPHQVWTVSSGLHRQQWVHGSWSRLRCSATSGLASAKTTSLTILRCATISTSARWTTEAALRTLCVSILMEASIVDPVYQVISLLPLSPGLLIWPSIHPSARPRKWSVNWLNFFSTNIFGGKLLREA